MRVEKPISDTSPHPPGASPGWRVVLGWILLAAWAVLVFVFFASNLRSFLEPMLGFAKTVGFMALCSYSFWILGWRLRSRFLPRGVAEFDGLEAFLVELALGVGCVMVAMFTAGACGLYHPVTAWVVVAAPLVGTHLRALSEVRKRWRELQREIRPSVLWILLLLTAVMTLFESLAPATSQDAFVYHLAVPARFMAEGNLHYVPGNFYSAFPMNVEMLFTLGLLLDSEPLAKWFHWMLGAGAVAAVAALARHLAARSRERTDTPCGLLAATLFATIPTVALIAGWAYVDLGVVFFITLSSLFFLRFWESQRGRKVESLRHESTPYLVLSVVLAGIAAGCKYTAGFQGLLIAAFVLVTAVREKRSPRLVCGQVGTVCFVVLAFASPWFVKNMITTGNPLFPFAYSLLGGDGWDADRSRVLAISLSEWGGGRPLWQLPELIWDVTVSGQFFSQAGFDGVIGCGFLIGAPFLLVGWTMSREYRVAAWFFILHGVFWVTATQQIRFLLPALAVAAALIAVALCYWKAKSGSRLPIVLLQASAFANVLLIAVHFGTHNPLPVVLGFEVEDSYLEREVPGGDYAVFRHIEAKLPLESRILFGSCGNPAYLCKRDYHSDALFENFTLVRLLEGAETPEELSRRFADAGYTHLLFRFDCVFDPSGRKSEVPLKGQLLLAEFLSKYSRLELQADQTRLHSLLLTRDVASPGAER